MLLIVENNGYTLYWWFSGLDVLISVDERFRNYRNDLFSHKSREMDRELMGIEENNRINATISSYLRLISIHFQLPSSIKTLEYLIRRYKWAFSYYLSYFTYPLWKFCFFLFLMWSLLQFQDSCLQFWGFDFVFFAIPWYPCLRSNSSVDWCRVSMLFFFLIFLLSYSGFADFNNSDYALCNSDVVEIQNGNFCTV